MINPSHFYYPRHTISIESIFIFLVILFTFVMSALFFVLIEVFKHQLTAINLKDLDNKLWIKIVRQPPQWITSAALAIGRSIWLLPALRAIQLGYEFFITQNHVTYLRAFGLLGEFLLCYIIGGFIMSAPHSTAQKYYLRWVKKMNEHIKLELKRLRREYETGKVPICDLYLLEAFHYGKANTASFSDFKDLVDKTTDPRDRWKLFDTFFRGPTTFFNRHNVKIPSGIIPADFDSLQNEYFFWFWETAIGSFLKAHSNIAAKDCEDALNNLKESWHHLSRGLKHLRSDFNTVNDRNAELVNLYNKLINRLSRDGGWSDEKIALSFG